MLFSVENVIKSKVTKKPNLSIMIIINTLFSEGCILSYYNKYNKLIYNIAF